jgi:hypothetical protein
MIRVQFQLSIASELVTQILVFSSRTPLHTSIVYPTKDVEKTSFSRYNEM